MRTYTERVPRFDSRGIPILLEFDQAGGISTEALAAKVIDNSLVDQLVAEKFIERVYGKELR